MAVELRATLEGDVQLSRKLMKIPASIDNFQVPLRNIEREVMASVEANYSSRGGLFGKWPKRKDNKPHPLLEKTGVMRGNFKKNLGSDYVEIFNPTHYFKYHQSNKPRTKLPRRIMLKIDKIRRTFIVKEFQRHIVESMRGSRWR